MKDAKILIVEDEVLVAHSLEKLLRKFGYTAVLMATKGSEALAKAVTDDPGLILMDIKLRNTIDGIQAAELIREQRRIPIIYLTAYSDEETLERAKQTEPFAYLTKPINEQELRINIEMALYRSEMERRLRESEEQYRRIVELANEGIWAMDAEFTTSFVNQGMLDILGYAEQEMIGRPIYDFLFEEDAPEQRQRMAERARGETGRYEQRFRRRDGRPCWLYVSATPLQDAQGHFAGSFGMFTDITARKEAEDALRRSKAQLEMTARAGNVGLWDWDIASNRVYYSPEWKRQVGYEGDEITNDFSEWQRRVHPDDLEKTLATVHQFMRDPWPNYEVEFRLQHKDGSYRWILARADLIRDNAGRPVRMLGSHLDITARKEAEEKLQLTQRSVDIAAISIFWITPEGRVFYANQYACLKLGYCREEIVLLSVAGFDPDFPPEARAAHWQRIKEQKSIVFESRHRAKDGSVLPVQITSNYLQFDGAEYELAFAQDISERKLAETAHNRLMTAIEQSAEAFVITDANAAIQYVNPAFERITGYAAREALGNNPRILQSGQHDSLFYQELWDTVVAGHTWKGHFVNRKKDGTLYDEEAVISPVKDSAGTIVNYVAVKRDITAELRLEEQLRQTQKLEAIGTLAGGIAHDFNNILAGIINYTELALDEIPEQFYFRHHLEEALKLCGHARDLIKNLILFSRPVKQALKPLSLDAAIRDFMHLLRATIPSSIEIAYDHKAGGGMIVGDAVQIQQVLLNICKNAADAMQGQSGMLQIALGLIELHQKDVQQYPGLQPGPYCELTISDTGKGIDPAILGRIFEPFFSTKGVEQGSGMGLAMVHGIIKNHKGHISVRSAPGRGTTFTILLPRVVALPEASEQPAEQLLPGSERILLIDDEKSIVITVKMFLENLGYAVTATMDSLEGLELFRAAPAEYDLIITDQTMPHLSGNMLAQEVMRIRPEIPIILTTGFSDSVDEGKARALGIKALLMKPYRRGDLARRIRAILDAQAPSLQEK